MQSDNSLLAEFLGWKYEPEQEIYDNGLQDPPYNQPERWLQYAGQFCYIHEKLHFHSDWNDLMKVIDKIESVRHTEYGWFMVSVQSNVCHIHSQHLTKSMGQSDVAAYMSDPNAVFPTKIESVWYNCVQFVKFYNENLK